jgi:tRNA nucleotidyltransferase (CCA-adding enzyme)
MNIKLELKLKRETLALVKKAAILADKRGIKAWLVGGLVRDIMLGGKDGDVDITVEGDGMAFARALADLNGAAYKGFEKFGTGKVFFRDGRRIDVASARSEKYRYTASLPEIKFTTLEKDLFRRDFTINSMAIALNGEKAGELLDPFGGMKDIKEKKLRAIHDKSFLDDPTRILRGIRFEGRFGFKMEKKTAGLLKQAVKAGAFGRAPGERLRDELLLFFAEPDPLKPLLKLEKFGITRAIHRDIKTDKITSSFFNKLKKHKGNPPGLDCGLLYMLSIAPTPAALRRLKSASRWIKAAGGLIDLKAAVKILSIKGQKRSAVYSMLAGKEPEALYFFSIISEGKEIKNNIGIFMEKTGKIKADLTGADLRGLGIKPGPVYSKLLKRALLGKIDGEAPGKKEQLELVKAVMNSEK